MFDPSSFTLGTFHLAALLVLHFDFCFCFSFSTCICSFNLVCAPGSHATSLTHLRWELKRMINVLLHCMFY
ncbi:hypothetical protein LOK49_Contig14G00013 [Camellia lanceoleosa]|nr:hypothetical protein LOK49_Contig14G00013 [Camellia lanceoleosa]